MRGRLQRFQGLIRVNVTLLVMGVPCILKRDKKASNLEFFLVE